MKIENDNELAQAKRDLEAFERHSTALSTACQIRFAIAEYERDRECARVAEIAAGLSDKAKARLIFLGAGDNSNQAVRDVCIELEDKQLEAELSSIATPLGLKVLAELQKPAPLPKRWGVFGVDSNRMYCECQKEEDAITIRTALFRYGLSTYVRQPTSAKSNPCQ